MQERYRSDYDGEFVILRTYFKDGQKLQDKEWIPNPVENQYLSARAAVIGYGQSREKFQVKKLQDHRGGLLGSKRLQTYGAQGCWPELRFDFYVENDQDSLRKLIKHRYMETCTVYSNVKNCIKYPGQFYLTPYNVKLTNIATAIYIAAFDGHKEIFLLGVDGTLENGEFNIKEATSINNVIRTYSNTTFYFVTDWVGQTWYRNHTNVKTINYNEFVSYCDI